MRISVGSIRLFFEVVGTKLTIQDGVVNERPTVIFLHGGPAWDHLTLRPDFESLADVAQLVFYDHRGLGRSDRSDSSQWNLSRWATDLKALIDSLEIIQPIIFGQSFGGMVAQQFALDYPSSYRGLVLSATAARLNLPAILNTFERISGPDTTRLVELLFNAAASEEQHAEFIRRCLPYYTYQRKAIGGSTTYRSHVQNHYWSDKGEGRFFDFRGRLHEIVAPTLVLGGDCDPVFQPAVTEELYESFRPGVAQLKIFERCGHGPARDRADESLPLLREFITLCQRSSSR